MLGTIFQNRGWILPDYFNSIQKLEYPKNDIHLCFIDDGSSDNGFKLLRQFKSIFDPLYYKIDIWRKTSEYQDSRKKDRDYSHFANVRNLWLSMRNEDDSLIFSIDSDILVPPNLISRLKKSQRKTNAKMISALVYNGYDCYNIANQTDRKDYVHIKPNDEIINADVTGATSLILKEVLDAGCCFNYHNQGEDVPFCEQIREKFGENSIFCDTSLQVDHIMEKN